MSLTRSRIVQIGLSTTLIMLGSACIVHRPNRTYDYADVTAHPSESCNSLKPPAEDECGLNYPTDEEVKTTGKPRKAFNSSVCTSIDELRVKTPAGDAVRNAVQCFAHERFKAADGNVGLAHEAFDLHIVEFDDEGQPWNAEREDRTLEALQKELTRPAVVITFVHGWKNNADVCNGNLSCFRQVLEILAKAEKLYADVSGTSPRRVIGIYIGWRGGSVSVEPAKTGLTFWGRKHTAHVIGDNGGVTALIRRVRTIVDESRQPQQPYQAGSALSMTSLVFVGHSFGGALLFSALGTSLNASIGEALQAAANPDRPEPNCGAESTVMPLTSQVETRGRSAAQPLLAAARPVYVATQGDLVMLVNPATEGSRFANLNQAAQVPFHPCQVPIFVTLASEADWEVGALFPIGQSVSTLLRSARSRDAWFSMLEGLGMYKPYHSHRLSMKALPNIPATEKISGLCECPSNIRAVGDALVQHLKPLYEQIAKLPVDPTTLQLSGYQEFMYSRLEPVQDVDPNNPFMTVQVDREIVSGHSDIFNARFVDFLIEFVLRTEVKRELVRLRSGGTVK